MDDLGAIKTSMQELRGNFGRCAACSVPFARGDVRIEQHLYTSIPRYLHESCEADRLTRAAQYACTQRMQNQAYARTKRGEHVIIMCASREKSDIALALTRDSCASSHNNGGRRSITWSDRKGTLLILGPGVDDLRGRRGASCVYVTRLAYWYMTGDWEQRLRTILYGSGPSGSTPDIVAEDDA